MYVQEKLQPEKYVSRKARTLLASLANGIPQETLQDAQLVVSELVTNAFVHGPVNKSILLRLELGEGVLRGVVCDEGSGFEILPYPTPREDLTGGFGLVIVNKLCSKWGVAEGERFGVSFEISW